MLQRGPAAPLVIQASTDKGYVTIHDYVVAVHAYLQSHRDEIVAAHAAIVASWGGPEVPEDSTLYVDPSSLDSIKLDDGNSGGLSGTLWSTLASHVDQRLGVQPPSREEVSPVTVQTTRIGLDGRAIREEVSPITAQATSMGHNGPPVFTSVQQAMEWNLQNPTGVPQPYSSLSMREQIAHSSRMASLGFFRTGLGPP